MSEDQPTNETPEEQPVDETTAAEETPAAETPAEEPQAAAEEAPAEEEPVADEPVAEEAPAEEAPAEEPVAEAGDEDEEADEEPTAPRVKPAIPGADLEVDLVLEGENGSADPYASYDEDGEPTGDGGDEESDVVDVQPVAATIDLAADARYKATGKRKTAVARVILRPGTGVYTINGKPMDAYFPRPTLQRQIRQPLEAVGYEERMDVVARLHGSGVSAQAGALRHGISRALLDADPNLRGELKRRGFLTRDARSVERKKAGLKKARKRPQFSKR
jgi:small subunit ribosomal protein S9